MDNTNRIGNSGRQGLFKRDEGRRIPANVAKLLDLLRKMERAAPRRPWSFPLLIVGQGARSKLRCCFR
jgi:hypothetical protein